MTGPLVDFLVPVYNAAETLDAALASIAAQDMPDFRVILVDDGSTDASPALLARWQARDPRFEVIRQANAGIVSALNAGLALTTAPLVARMDADDLCAPYRLTRQLAWLAAHPDCAATGGRVEHIDAAGRPVPGLPQPGDPALADPAWFPAREPYLIHPFLTARTAAIKAAGGYRHVPNSEDSDLYWRLAERGALHNLPDVLGQYRVHAGSVSGGAVVDGRLTAIGSRLGALSAVRRRAGRPDVVFVPELKARLRASGSLTAMCAIAEELVEPDERAAFRLGTGIKLLELAGYRPYEVTADDCAFVARSLSGAPPVGPANRREIDWHLAATAARLLRGGRWRAARELAAPRLALRIAAHLLRH